MGNETVLEFDEIVSVNKIDDLVRLYSQKGLSFENQDKFLDQLSKDWGSEVDRLEDLAKSMPIPQKLPSLDLTLDGANYGIFGVTHDFTNGSRYRRLVSDAVNGRQNWLYEHGIGFFFKKENGSVEIPDCSVNEFWTTFKEGLISGIALPLFSAYMVSRYIRPSKTSENDLLKLNVPAEAREKLPAYVSLQLKEEMGKPYSRREARSGYHAEFLRAYKPDEDKNFLCGAAHTPEIKHFLINGVKDSRIVDLAHSHAEILVNDPEKLHSIQNKTSAKEGLAISSGIIAGSSPYLALYAYFL